MVPKISHRGVRTTKTTLEFKSTMVKIFYWTIAPFIKIGYSFKNDDWDVAHIIFCPSLFFILILFLLIFLMVDHFHYF